MSQLVNQFNALRQVVLALPVLSRPPGTQFGALQVPKRPVSLVQQQVNGTIAAAGGSLTILAAPAANTCREIIGAYYRQTGGTSRNWVIEYFDGTTALPLSDNNSASKSLSGTLMQRPTGVIRITAEAAADVGTWQGITSGHLYGFGAMAT